MLINLLMMILLAVSQFVNGRQNDWTTRMDYLRKIQVRFCYIRKQDVYMYSKIGKERNSRIGGFEASNIHAITQYATGTRG